MMPLRSIWIIVDDTSTGIRSGVDSVSKGGGGGRERRKRLAHVHVVKMARTPESRGGVEEGGRQGRGRI